MVSCPCRCPPRYFTSCLAPPGVVRAVAAVRRVRAHYWTWRVQEVSKEPALCGRDEHIAHSVEREKGVPHHARGRCSPDSKLGVVPCPHIVHVCSSDSQTVHLDPGMHGSQGDRACCVVCMCPLEQGQCLGACWPRSVTICPSRLVRGSCCRMRATCSVCLLSFLVTTFSAFNVPYFVIHAVVWLLFYHASV
jgi:hypothetical protein